MSQPVVKEESVDISLAKLPGRFTFNRRTRKREWSTTLPVILRDLAPTSGFDPQKVWQKEQEAELAAERKAGNEEKDDDDNNNNSSSSSNNKKKTKKEKQPVISKKDAIIAERQKQREANDLDKDTQRIVNMKKVGGVKALVDIRNQIKTPIAKLELFLEILSAAVTKKDKELSFDVFWAIEAYELYQQAKAELSARKALSKSKEKDSKESKSKDSKDKKGKDKDSKDKGKEEKIPPKSPEAELLSKYKEVLKTVKEWRSAEDIIVFQLTNMSNRLPPLSPFTSDFRLDPWQKRVLQLIDARKSIVISAPTSSGKTVISTYVATLGRALNKEPTPPPTIPHRLVTINANGEEEEEIDGDEEENDTVVSTKDRVLFIVPTEPLVWQVAAHFARHILNGNVALVTNQMIYSPHPTLKEPPAVVVGTPAALETALTKIRGKTSILERNHLVDRAQVVGGFHHYGWVVYDEIHVLDGDEGEALQRLIRLMKCNFLALSATVGNAEDLRTWMEKVRGEQLNVEVINAPRNDDMNNIETTSLSTNEIIIDEDHKPPVEELLKRADIADTNRLVKLQIHEDRFINIQRHIWTRSEQTNQFELKSLHPLSAVTLDFLKQKGFKSAALPMTPRDSYQLYTSMKRFYPKEVISELDPHNFFQSDDSNRITLRQSKDYEDKLKSKLEKLAHTHEAETNQLLHEFDLKDLSEDYNVCELAFELKRQDKLPTLMFHLNVFDLINYFRELLEGIEAKQKEAHPNYYRNLQQKANAKKAMQEGVQREAKTNREVEDAQREGVIEDTVEVVDYTAPHPDFVFTPGAPISSREFEDICQEVKSRDRFEGDFTKHALMRALRRGIGIYINDHHFTAYRVAIMRLALQGKLGIVLSDSSLAYGVNMPFRSCVFCGEMGGLLNPILAQQMAGRSGRRGYDTEGHLIYLGAKADFVRELMLAKIPAITGREPRYHTQFLQEMLSLYSNPKPLYPNQMDHLGGETLKDYVHSIHPDLLLENKKIVHAEDILLEHKKDDNGKKKECDEEKKEGEKGETHEEEKKEENNESKEEKTEGDEEKKEVKVETNHLKLIEGVTVLDIPETDDEYGLPNFRQVSIELLMELQLIEECDKLSPDTEEELRDAEAIDFNDSATISGYRPFQGANFNISDLTLNVTCGQLWMIWQLRNTLPDSITLGCMLPALYEEFIHRKSDPGEDVSSRLTFLLFLLFTVDRVPYDPSASHSTVPLLEHPFVVTRELKDKLVAYELKMLEIQNKIINLNLPLKKSLLQSYPIGEPLDSIVFETIVNPGIISTLPHEVKAFLKEKYLSLSIKLAIMHNCLYRETSKYTKFEVLTRKCFATIQYISREMLQSIINFDDVSSADTERLGQILNHQKLEKRMKRNEKE